jgi:membrane protein YqaA with SNARE-associated domain
MKVLLKVVATLFVAIAAFLVYAVVAAAGSAGGARVGVSIGYVAGALVLSSLAVVMWRRPGRSSN